DTNGSRKICIPVKASAYRASRKSKRKNETLLRQSGNASSIDRISCYCRPCYSASGALKVGTRLCNDGAYVCVEPIAKLISKSWVADQLEYRPPINFQYSSVGKGQTIESGPW